MIRFVAALLGLLSWGCTAFFSITFPLPDSLGSGPFNPAWSWGWILVAGGVAAWIPWMVWQPKGERGGGQLYTVLILVSLLVQLGLSLGASAFLHRDFMSIVFQAVAIHYALFLDAVPRLGRGGPRRLEERLFLLSMGFVVFFLVWIGLMGYAIASRAEPRWIPSLGYNAVNLVICFYLAVADMNLRAGSKREVIVETGTVLVNGLDILPLVGESTRAFVSGLLTRPGEALSCRTALALCGLPASACRPGCDVSADCPCLDTLRARARETGRLFSALKLGALREVGGNGRESGVAWVFSADESVRLHVPGREAGWRA